MNDAAGSSHEMTVRIISLRFLVLPTNQPPVPTSQPMTL